jgi:hypothetical protein
MGWGILIGLDGGDAFRQSWAALGARHRPERPQPRSRSPGLTAVQPENHMDIAMGPLHADELQVRRSRHQVDSTTRA